MALISFDDDPWIADHEACESLYRDIQSQIVIWERELRSSAVYGHLSSRIRAALKQYRINIADLSEQLKRSRNENSITFAECERRSRQIEILQSKCTQLQNQFNNGVHSSAVKIEYPNTDSSRQQLFGNTSGAGYNQVETVNWGTNSDDEKLIDAEVYQPSLDQIKQRKNELIRDQDAGLDALSKIISLQRDIAENLGNEVSLQNDLIDEIGVQIDITDGRVQQETQAIRNISTSDSTCYYWTIIIILMIVIIAISVFG